MESRIKKIDIIISVLFGINVLILLLISLGIGNISEISFFKYYFIGSFTFVPGILALVLISNYINKSNLFNIKKNYSQYIPAISYILSILIVSIKMSIQLEKEATVEVLTIMFSLILLIIVITFIYRDKNYTLKRQIIYHIVTLFTNILFFVLISILSYDYSVLF